MRLHARNQIGIHRLCVINFQNLFECHELLQCRRLQNAEVQYCGVLNLCSSQVQDEGTKEATTYDKFACFCKSKTDEKSEAIETGQTAVETITANLGTSTPGEDRTLRLFDGKS